MATIALRFLTLLALVLMPYGIAATPLMAWQMAADHVSASTGPCDGQSGEHKAPDDHQMGCKGACTAIAEPFTPAIAVTTAQEGALPRSNARLFTGIEPEIATPPPKHS